MIYYYAVLQVLNLQGVREREKSAKITKLIKSGKGFLHDFRPGVWRKLIRLINLL